VGHDAGVSSLDIDVADLRKTFVVCRSGPVAGEVAAFLVAATRWLWRTALRRYSGASA
jgi:hypothetical protein